MTDKRNGPELEDRETAAAYLAQLSGDLAGIARRHGLDTLCYLFDMARLEAERSAGPPRRSEPR